VGCGRTAPKVQLVRFVCDSREEQPARVVLDASGKLPGRGAYICRDCHTGAPERECLALARRKRAFARALRRAVQAPEELQAVSCEPERRTSAGDGPLESVSR
jgi:predicted RNA-binding protein YlxR (DUF448 family)